MSEEYSLDPLIWYTDRELTYVPKHFTLARSALTIESKKWILTNLRGRFSFIIPENQSVYSVDYDTIPAFEDPQEAVMYELLWSS